METDCPLCGAVVQRKNVRLHEEWHERQTQILESLAEATKRLANVTAALR